MSELQNCHRSAVHTSTTTACRRVMPAPRDLHAPVCYAPHGVLHCRRLCRLHPSTAQHLDTSHAAAAIQEETGQATRSDGWAVAQLTGFQAREAGEAVQATVGQSLQEVQETTGKAPPCCQDRVCTSSCSCSWSMAAGAMPSGTAA